MISNILYYYLLKEMEEKSIENNEEPIILSVDLDKEEEEKINGLDNN